ncbi:MAG: 4-(cytidine 5'-diphospho)-2-C-methyl-D-erythritol kinase [Clostridia bacterium]|nr:4-(cytidine 5'-diphospho)-2-C-methyl-D-erythritol kinase [Clostridia bacterium]
MIETKAYAKLNLTLDVLGKRPDGYHDLRMVMQTVDLSDAITLEFGGEGVRAASNLGFLPTGEKNLAAAAALRFAEATGKETGGLLIHMEKSIPVCAGLGGGSSDAAAVLRALNGYFGAGLSPRELALMGERVGSDVPYCVLGGTALAEGRGEVLTPLPTLPTCDVVLCKPKFSISTPELFARLDGVRLRHRPDTEGVLAALSAGDLGGVGRRLFNVFEEVLPVRIRDEIVAIKGVLVEQGALGACMSGTGPTVYGLFSDGEAARRAYEVLKGQYRDVFLTGTRESLIPS